MSIRVKFGDPPYKFPIDPDDELDYSIDWSDFLGADTISTSAWTVTNITKETDSNSTTSTTIWVKDAVSGTRPTAKNSIVTAAGREKDLTLEFTVGTH